MKNFWKEKKVLSLKEYKNQIIDRKRIKKILKNIKIKTVYNIDNIRGLHHFHHQI